MGWRYSHSQSCWYFRPLLWTSAPLTFSLVDTPPPLPVWITTGVCIYTVCNGGGVGSGCVESIYRSYTQCIWPDFEPTKLLYHPKQKPRINNRRQVPLQVNVSESRHLGLETIVIWSMPGHQESIFPIFCNISSPVSKIRIHIHRIWLIYCT